MVGGEIGDPDGSGVQQLDHPLQQPSMHAPGNSSTTHHPLLLFLLSTLFIKFFEGESWRAEIVPSSGELALSWPVSFTLLASFVVPPLLFLSMASFLRVDLLRHVTYSLKEEGESDVVVDQL